MTSRGKSFALPRLERIISVKYSREYDLISTDFFMGAGACLQYFISTSYARIFHSWSFLWCWEFTFSLVVVNRTRVRFGKRCLAWFLAYSLSFLARPWPRRSWWMRSARRTNVWWSSTMEYATKPISLLSLEWARMTAILFVWSHLWNFNGR